MWPFNRMPSHLPVAEGPYVPGCADVMLKYSREGLFMRLYYPTDAQRDINVNFRKWIPWVPDETYVIGFSKLISTAPWVIKLVAWLYSGKIFVPVLFGEKIKSDEKLKVVMFSHGLGCNRFFYSTICNELASRGYVVVAVEHRDESNSTYFYESKENAQNDVKTLIHFKQIDFGKDHYEKRNVQVKKRSEECSQVLDFILNLNKGIVPHNVMDDVPTYRHSEFNLKDLIGKLDLDDLAIIGHSFGGATSLLTLSKRPEIRLGVVLDPWMFSIKAENVPENVTQPLIFINTQTFHIESNVKAMEQFLIGQNREMYTILHTTHESQTDTVFVTGYWLNWFMKKLSGRVALKINNFLILRFLNKFSGFPEDLADCNQCLKDQAHNVAEGLTKAWA